MLPPVTRFCVAIAGPERLDRFLADQLQVSRTVAARLIAERRVTVNAAAARPSLVPARGAEIVVTSPEVPPRQVRPAADITLTITYEDDDLLVVDKPAGLVVHPAPGHWDDTLVNALAARGVRTAGGTAERPGIVHRLDKDTSGLLVVAKSGRAHEKLGRALAARRIHRRYAALVWGHVGEGERRVEAPLQRHPVDRKRMMIPPAGGRQAVTLVRRVARGGAGDLVRCALETGRTHQIRVHLQSIGHPVVGDAVYGGLVPRRSDASQPEAEVLAGAVPRQALHAAWLRLTHPMSGALLDLRSEWPEDLRPGIAKALGDTHLLAEPHPLDYLGFFSQGGQR